MAKAEAAEAAAPAGGGKKKLIMILVIVVLLVAVGGGAALMLLKKKPKADEDGEEAVDDHAPQVEVAKAKPGTPPVYMPLEPFTVNLTDQDVDRYAQIGISLEVVDQKTADTLKGYLPSVRSGVLMVLSRKSAADLLSSEGKERLQKEIQREAVRPLGYEVDLDEASEEDTDTAKKKKKKKKKAPLALPVSNVHFSQFIVQ
ncbi:flagellar basal body-associated FliL family protein [Inhella gelatinilytica]|uniref:Flagellar protein FliL n=1 Tax=Inhella gelatinilytica TaxID=2795030 RepID=A0A931ITZ8_9BURK|nr:flagellar basal body-associated FliL family protein [Inhella gelatinilytica]MBH9552742.1 flagellar basal body-associated FliL family protein [Inhella gelatinilytica]